MASEVTALYMAVGYGFHLGLIPCAAATQGPVLLASGDEGYLFGWKG